jgi:porphobilinogen synthase
MTAKPSKENIVNSFDTSRRARRLRQKKALRELIREIRILPTDLIQPYFVIPGIKKEVPVSSMPGISRYSSDLLLKEIEKYIKAGGRAGLFFGIPSKKNSTATEAFSASGCIQKAIRSIKREFPEFLIISDVCLCAYTDHGHCGIIKNNKIDNDATLPLLSKTALSHAQAGADFVAPSDMMDFRVQHIRKTLDKNNFTGTGIISYAVKYKSAFYGPFREAAHSAPSFDDRASYQMDYANKREALAQARQDVLEGADIIMVKPAISYLDIISMLKNELTTPLAAYQVSGEYSMIKAAAQKNWINEKAIVLETLTGIKRAGADIIFSYYAQETLKWINE